MSVINITLGNFQNEVMDSDRPVLLDFWAPWCGPCQMLLPVIEELAGEVDYAKICKVNTDEEPELAEQFNVMSIPTLIVIKNGKVDKVSVGVKPKSEIIEMIK